MAKELVNLSNSNDELLEQVQELPILREQYKVNFALVVLQMFAIHVIGCLLLL